MATSARPENHGKTWGELDCITLVCMLNDGYGFDEVGRQLGRSGYAVQCQEKVIRQAGRWDWCLERRWRIRPRLDRLQPPSGINCRCVIQPTEGEEDMAAEDKVPFLKTETVTAVFTDECGEVKTEIRKTTYLKGRDLSDYSDDELIGMLGHLGEKRDKLLGDTMVAASKMGKEKIDRLQRLMKQLVDAMDRLYDERQAAKEAAAK